MPELPKEQQMTLFAGSYDAKLNAWNFKRLLAQKYDVVVTNPPYMGNKGLNGKMSEYLQTNYSDYKSDTFSAFIIRCGDMAKPSGYIGMFSPYVWMFIQSYEKLRKNVFDTKNITTLIQFEYSAFEEATVPVCSFVYQNTKTGEKGGYFRLVDFRGGMEIQRQKYLEAIENPKCGFFYIAASDNFVKIPGSPVAYWVSENFVEVFNRSKPLSEIAVACVGLQTSDNSRFVRLWYEVSLMKIGFGISSLYDAKKSLKKWFPYNKGGGFRRWYGNQECIVNWENDGDEIKKYNTFLNSSRASNIGIANTQYYFKESGSWGLVSSSQFSVRFTPCGSIFDTGGSSVFSNENIKYIIALLNSKIATLCLQIQNPTLNFQPGNVGRLPYVDIPNNTIIVDLVDNSITISKTDWDSFETSYDFEKHPLSNGLTVQSAFENWETSCNERFAQLKRNEEELNRVFIDIYGLQDELTPEVHDKDVTVRRADLSREIRSLISYAVGCMFGRYSLDIEGLAYAGGDWDNSKYKTFIPDKDNILPICDDEYFDDDILGRFVDFVRVVYGLETLEENLKYIADALGGNGKPREVIRNYFLNDFYKDHCKIFQKRPIYWLFDSGKKNGFKALIYLHRYQSDLLAKLRTDYVHEQQERYRTQLSHIAAALNTATGSERAKLLKQQDKLSEQLKEITAFEEKVHHLADQNIKIDLDDGVKKNYEIFTDVLAKM